MAAVEIYELPQGKIAIISSDERLSIGLLELNPKQELPKHNRPVKEALLQVSGSCAMKLFKDSDSVEEVTLKEGKSLEIPANQFHIHSNPTNDKALTLWKFEGNITEIIKDIGDKFKKVSQL
jgi:quercetin dioxygenase-like cupin family protein